MSVDSRSVQCLRSNVAALMKLLGLNQIQVAEKAGITNVHLNRILRGKCVPSLDLVDQLAEALGTSAERLVHFDSEPAGKKAKQSA